MRLVLWISPLSPATAQQDVLWAGAIFLLALLAAVWVARWVQRRWDPRHRREKESGPPLDIEGIEEMHRSGQISDEEFQALRRTLLGLGSAPEKESSCSCGGGIIDDSNKGKPCADATGRSDKDSE
jgi:hypothetical protein